MKARLAARNVTVDGELQAARDEVQAAKVALGESGPVWWDDGAEDFSGRDPVDTPYADWWNALPHDDRLKGG